MSEAREIDVEQIMRRIRENVRQRRSSEGLPSGEKRGSPFDDGQGAVDFTYLDSGHDIRHVSFSSHRWIVGPLVVAIKTVLRKLLTPVLDRQVAYNAANARVITHLKEWIEALDYQCALVSRQIETLERSRAELQELASRTQLELREIASNLRPGGRTTPAVRERGPELDGAGFEPRFRGREEDVKERKDVGELRERIEGLSESKPPEADGRRH